MGHPVDIGAAADHFVAETRVVKLHTGQVVAPDDHHLAAGQQYGIMVPPVG